MSITSSGSTDPAPTLEQGLFGSSLLLEQLAGAPPLLLPPAPRPGILGNRRVANILQEEEGLEGLCNRSHCCIR